MKDTNSSINRQTPFAELPELLRPMEVRAFLGVGHNTVYQAIQNGELPSRRIGRIIFVPKSALLEMAVA